MTLVQRQIAEGVGRITLNRPSQMNAITVALARGLETALLEVGNDPAVNVIVIRGAGGNFCAGGDFTEVERLTAESHDALRSLFVSFRRACEAIARIDAPVIAAVEGVAMAGGFGRRWGWFRRRPAGAQPRVRDVDQAAGVLGSGIVAVGRAR